MRGNEGLEKPHKLSCSSSLTSAPLQGVANPHHFLPLTSAPLQDVANPHHFLPHSSSLTSALHHQGLTNPHHSLPCLSSLTSALNHQGLTNPHHLLPHSPSLSALHQGVANPVPRVRHPDWLHKKLADMNDKCQQLKLDAMLPMLRAAGAKNRAGGASWQADLVAGWSGCMQRPQLMLQPWSPMRLHSLNPGAEPAGCCCSQLQKPQQG